VNPAGSSVLSTAGRNATITSLMVCCGFIICWSPNQIIFFLSSAGYPVDFGGWFYHFINYQSIVVIVLETTSIVRHLSNTILLTYHLTISIHFTVLLFSVA